MTIRNMTLEPNRMRKTVILISVEFMDMIEVKRERVLIRILIF